MKNRKTSQSKSSATKADAATPIASSDNKSDQLSGQYIILLFAFRLLNACIVRTYYNPDEYWQSVEVAHDLAFGYGHKTWEWQTSARIRGFVHPLTFALAYKLVALLGLDSRMVVACLPWLLQGCMAAVGDIFLFKLAARQFSVRVAYCALACSVCNWFVFYCMVRTFSNSIETVLTTIAFFYWPWPRTKEPAGLLGLSARQTSLVFAALAFAYRPSNAIIWLPLGAFHLLMLPSNSQRLRFVVREVLTVGFVCLAATVCIDSACYGRWTFVPYNFVSFNALTGGSELYGANAWHYYLLECPFATLNLFLPFAVYAVWQSVQSETAGSRQRWSSAIALLQQPFAIWAWTCFVYSLNAHKEYRFVLPVLPLAVIYAGRGVEAWFVRSKGSIAFRATIAFVACLNVLAALFLSVFFQRAPIAVMRYLSAQADLTAWSPSSSSLGWLLSTAAVVGSMHDTAFSGALPRDLLVPLTSVHFLMGCHSTPWYSQLHSSRVVPMEQLDCSPNRNATGHLTLALSESAVFAADPLAFAERFYYDSHRPLFEPPRTDKCTQHAQRQSCVKHAGCAWFACHSDVQTTGCVSMSALSPVHGFGGVCSDNVAVIELWWEYWIADDINNATRLPLLDITHETGGQSQTIESHACYARSQASNAWRVVDCLRPELAERAIVWPSHHLPASTAARNLPSHIVIWQQTAPKLLPFLLRHRYALAHRLFHAFASDEGRYLDVYAKIR